MKIGSLFAGIGALEYGLELAGVGETIWQVESDPFARSRLARHWPGAKQYDNVCGFGIATADRPDALCGGFPCTDISLAGPGDGFAGARSGLWREYARCIGEFQPRIAVVENVSNLLAVNGGADFATVLSDLASLGYDAWWDCIPASAVGAAHERDRVFLVAYTRGARGPRLEPSEDSGPLGSWRVCRSEDLRAIAAAPLVVGDRWPQPLIRRMDDGTADRMDRLRCVGNAVDLRVAYVIGKVAMQIAESLP